MVKDDNPLLVELPVLLRLDANPSQALSRGRQAAAMPASPVQLPGSMPSAMTNSISGWAQSVELKSPCSQAA
jgi:hypothetical protein